MFSGISGLIGGFDSCFSIRKAFSYQPQLPYNEAKLKDSYSYQDESEDALPAGMTSQISIQRSFYLALFSILYGLLGALFGWNIFYDKRAFSLCHVHLSRFASGWKWDSFDSAEYFSRDLGLNSVTRLVFRAAFVAYAQT